MGLFLSKSTAWKDEKEWRLIFSYLQLNAEYNEADAENEKELYNFEDQDIDFDCATEIFLGPKMESTKKMHICEIGRRLGIEVFEMQLSNDKYELVPRKLNFEDNICPYTNEKRVAFE